MRKKEDWNTKEHMKADLKKVAKDHGDIFPELKKMVEDDKYDPEYWLKALERYGDCTGGLKNTSNIGLTEWCVGCLQTFTKKLIKEFLRDFAQIHNSEISYFTIQEKWEKRLSDATGKEVL